MLEHGDVLLTWQLLRDPTAPHPFPIPARRIGDHRKAYLTYEGPLTGDRGAVRRVEEGTVEVYSASADAYAFALIGRQLAGKFTLLRTPDGDWLLGSAEPQ